MTPARLYRDRCICCEHPFSGASPEALHAAILAHAEYVNATADKTTDSHFEDLRLNALVLQ